jgi:hypothetical protein
MPERGLFTGQEVWNGGYYELFIRPSADSAEELCSILKALWSFPSLEGCYLSRHREPSLQTPITPCENGVAGHLYGLAKVHDCVVACGLTRWIIRVRKDRTRPTGSAFICRSALLPQNFKSVHTPLGAWMVCQHESLRWIRFWWRLPNGFTRGH